MLTLLQEADKSAANRRGFLKWSGGLVVGASVLATACKKDDDDVPGPTTDAVNLGTGDTAILNYAYALEQLEADFYTKVCSNAQFTTIFSADEQKVLKDIRDHEIIHREFFRAAISTGRIPLLTTQYPASVDFANKASVLATAKTLRI